MTLEEAIKHAEEVADEKKEEACNLYDDKNYEESRECIWCAEEHRQLAEWLKDYKRLLKQEPKTKWIPVSERLPEDDEDVLVCFEQGGMEVAYYHIDNTYYPTQFEDMNETGWFNEEDDAFYSEPIAWMQLPQPYKAESEE